MKHGHFNPTSALQGQAYFAAALKRCARFLYHLANGRVANQAWLHELIKMVAAKLKKLDDKIHGALTCTCVRQGKARSCITCQVSSLPTTSLSQPLPLGHPVPVRAADHVPAQKRQSPQPSAPATLDQDLCPRRAARPWGLCHHPTRKGGGGKDKSS